MSCTTNPTCNQGGVDLRPAVPSDAAAVAAVHRKSILATYPRFPTTRRSVETGWAAMKAVWDGRLRHPGQRRSTVVATDGGEVCGFTYFGPTPDTDDDPATVGQVLSIHVSPGMTRQGLGRRLLEAAIAGLGAEGHTVATLWVVVGNDRARCFYERLGWSRDGARRSEILTVGDGDGDPVDVIRYRRRLDREDDPW